MRRESPWNHNIHFHPVVLDAVPVGARRALDVGCGTGGLARELAERVPEVVGLDPDEPTLRKAAAEPAAGVTCHGRWPAGSQPGCSSRGRATPMSTLRSCGRPPTRTPTRTPSAAVAERVLPGVEYRRRVLWRYTLVWRKPAA